VCGVFGQEMWVQMPEEILPNNKINYTFKKFDMLYCHKLWNVLDFVLIIKYRKKYFLFHKGNSEDDAFSGLDFIITTMLFMGKLCKCYH
jgi:hypothetical protein